jgi:hypothetical protein
MKASAARRRRRGPTRRASRERILRFVAEQREVAQALHRGGGAGARSSSTICVARTSWRDVRGRDVRMRLSGCGERAADALVGLVERDRAR